MSLLRVTFGTFSALIFGNPEFSLTHNDRDTLLYTLGTLIGKAVKAVWTQLKFQGQETFFLYLFNQSDILRTLGLNVLSRNSTEAAKNDPMPPAL